MRPLGPAGLGALVLLSALPLLASAARPGPVLAIDTRSGELRFEGRKLEDFRAATLVRVLGKPGRVVTTSSQQRFERFGFRGGAPHSTVVTITDRHHVYDRLGLVFSTRNSSRFADPAEPEVLYVVLRPGAGADQRERPAVMPRAGFTGTLTINGERLDPDRLPVPAGVDHRTEKFPLFGTRFSSTSRATVIDSVYVQDDRRAVRLFADGRTAGGPGGARVGYLQIR